MDINPFDQFASDLKAAVPNAPAPAAVPNLMAQPPPQPKQPVMMTPPPHHQQQHQQQQYNGGGGGYGNGGGMYGGGGAMVPSTAPPGPYGGYGVGAPPPAAPAPYGAPPPQQQQQQYGGAPMPMYGNVGVQEQAPPPAAPPVPVPDANPFGTPPPMPAAPAPVAPPVANVNPFGDVASPPPAPVGGGMDPFGASFGSPAAPAPSVGVDPFAPAPAVPPTPPPAAPSDIFGGGAMVPAGAPASAAVGDLDALFGLGSPAPAPVAADPFGAPAPSVAAPPPAAPAPAYEDPLAGFGDDFGIAPAAGAPMGGAGAADTNTAAAASPARKAGELPPGGEYYDAKIFTPTLGVMFFKPQELTDSLFLQTDKDIIDGLEERPVVAFIVEGSSARSAGVELGHVLLKVNGIDVRNPKEASRLIKEGPRPLPLLFYVPNTTVVVAEGEHMVKYDTKETTAPSSHKDWKPKYVVIGGIIAQPWMINMYRSKSEYDIAVIETQARRPVSVKVKQFSLQGARIQNDWQGPQMVKYKNQLHPWKFFVVLPVVGNPIKISSPNLSALKPVHEGIRRYLMSQQRGGGSQQYPPPNSAAPMNMNRQDYGGYAPQQQHHQQQGYPPQQHADPYGAGAGGGGDPYGQHQHQQHGGGGYGGYDNGGGGYGGPPPGAGGVGSSRRSHY